MKLEQALKYYLGCGLKININSLSNEIITLTGGNYNECLFRQDKPIFYPLDLTNPIWYDRKEFTPINMIKIISVQYGFNKDTLTLMLMKFSEVENGYRTLPFFVIDSFVKWRIDVFNIIGQGLAIDVNTLETNPYK